ncbi:MAG: fluoride efflux transporter CrcB [Spirochaetaceae bacterium]|nr:fluoride efflux transporter CrcB [Spirochaetaceae bacterium]
MRTYLAVLIGGGLGAAARYGLTQGLNALWTRPFPLGTFCVNALGSLLIGFLFQIFEAHKITAEVRLLIITGFLGGYTTFSSYALETFRLFTLGGAVKQALLNILVNNLAALVLVALGMGLGRALVK